MQVMPSTGRWIAQKRGISGFTVDSLYDAQRSTDFGAWYIRAMLDKFDNNMYLAAAAYNGGPGNAGRWLRQFPTQDIDQFTEFIPKDETRDYVTKVMHNYFVYSAILGRD